MTAILDQLKPLPKLQKLHLGWYFATPWPDNQVVAEVARICGSFPLSLEWSTPEQIAQAAAVCSASDPKAPITINLTSQPYQGMAHQKLPANYVGPEFTTDLDAFTKRLWLFKDLPVTHVTFDVEQWPDSPGRWSKCDALSAAVDQALLHAIVGWYGKQAIQPNAGNAATGWEWLDYVDDLQAGYCGCPLYFSEHGINQQIFVRSRAGKPGRQVDAQVVPFVALGGCYRRSGSSWSKFAPPGPDPMNLWLAGLELNNQHPSITGNPERFPLSQAERVYLYHEVANEQWLPDIITYCQGAMNKPLAQPAAA